MFEDRWLGWRFEIADKILNGYKDEDGFQVPPVKESGYAALDNMFMYFESLGKHLEGYLDTQGRQSGKHFKIGLHSVVPHIKRQAQDQQQIEVIENLFWGGVRCGIYHSGAPKGHIGITGSIPEVFRVATDDKLLFLNPHHLIAILKDHLSAYCDHLLKQGENSDIGKKFIARYDYDNPVN